MMVRGLVVGMLIAPYAMAAAQEASLSDVLAGKSEKYPASYQPDDLPPSYSAVNITTSTDSWITLMMMSGRAGASTHGKVIGASWTNGDIVPLLKGEYLVTYQMDPLSSLITGMPAGGQGNSRPKLKLTLVRLDGIKSIQPCPELTRAELKEALRELEGGVEMQAMPAPPSPNAVASSPSSAETQTVYNLKQAALGTIMYANDWDDQFPYVQDTDTVTAVVQPYVKNRSVWQTLNPNGGRLLFNMGVSGAQTNSIPNPAETVMLYESKPWPNGTRVVAYCDGHVKVVDANQWKELAKKLRPKGIVRVGKPLKPIKP